MHPFETSHFSNRALLLDFDACVADDHKSFAVLLTRIAEIDGRRLYVPEGYSCMKDFLVGRMRLSEGAAYKRLTAARTARQYPSVLVALADGRLTLRAVLMLGRHLTSANADDLVASALDKTRFELEVLLAQLFPQPDLPERLHAIPSMTPTLSCAQPAPELSRTLAPERVVAIIPEGHTHTEADSLEGVRLPAPERAESALRSRVTPLAPLRFGFQFTGDQETHELYEQFRAMVSHEIPTGEMALVFKAALKIATNEVMKRKYALTGRPGHSRPTTSARHIPAAVQREVCERDGGRCSFVSHAGRRCEERRFLEFDHVVPVACGGAATAENLRLRCRAHNQYEAERAFGTAFMSEKRAKARAHAKARAKATIWTARRTLSAAT